MAEQLELLQPTLAEVLAASFGAEIRESDDPMAVFLAFGEAMARSEACTRHEFFDYISVVGFGIVNECHVWWMLDRSIMLVGWKAEDEDALAVGVLAPDSEFNPIPLTVPSSKTIH